jgi:hypothetical protein
VLPCQGAIAPGTSNNGELFLNVFDATAKVSYAHDIGIRMNDFFDAGQPDGGTQRFWVIENAIFSSFLTQVTADNLFWSVVAIDSNGSNAAGEQRLFTTIRQGDEAKVASMTNAKLSTGRGSTVAGNFFNSVNGTTLVGLGRSTHATSDPTSQTDYGINGSSYSLTTDSGFGYYGKSGGLTPTYNGNAAFNAANAVGASSWFYQLTRSSTSAGSLVTIDEFDNGDGVNAGSGHDGYWGFTLVNDAASPYNGQYLLSYTLEPRVWSFAAATAAQREFAASIGRTEFNAGRWIERLAGPAAAAAQENSAGWVTALAAAGGVPGGLPTGAPALLLTRVSSVPEPGSAALLLAGGGLLWLRRRAAVRATRPA